ncbi:hypothetical protein EUTSA_v10023995mg, partial [Eutrema salsugineum]
SEALIQPLRSENKNLQEIVKNLRNENTLIRHVNHITVLICPDVFIELLYLEKQHKTLSEEVVKLKELVQEGKTSETAQVTTRSKRKRSRVSEDMVETDMVSPLISKYHKATETLLVSQPQCCKTTYDGSSSLRSLATRKAPMLNFSPSLLTITESGLLYKVVSLGTFQRLGPKWMKDVIKFHTSMCPVFFERVSRLTKGKC